MKIGRAGTCCLRCARLRPTQLSRAGTSCRPPDQRRHRTHCAPPGRDSARPRWHSKPRCKAKNDQGEQDLATPVERVVYEPLKGLRIVNSFNLKEHELTVEQVHRNWHRALCTSTPSSMRGCPYRGERSLVAYSGVKTGRSPRGQARWQTSHSENDVWWGRVNIPLEPKTFAINRERARDYLNSRERLYCFEWLCRLGLKIIASGSCYLLATVACAFYAYHAHPSYQDELENFGAPEFGYL